MAEFSLDPRNGQEQEDIPWEIFFYRYSTEASSSGRVVLISANQHHFYQALTFNFKASNNKGEYEALITGLRMAKQLGISKVIAHSHSQFILNQTNESFQTKDESMTSYL